jgi:spore maturation protein CgeB
MNNILRSVLYKKKRVSYDIITDPGCTHHLKVNTNNVIRVITSFYIPKNPERFRELKECLLTNSKLLIELHIVCEDSETEAIVNSLAPSSIVHRINTRPTYSDMIRIVQENSTENTIFVLINSDIMLDETIALLNDTIRDNVCVCLLRWEINKPNLNNNLLSDSQDVWCWKTKLDAKSCGNYHMGVRGCDNKFANELLVLNFTLTNPFFNIISMHNHLSNVRSHTYDTIIIPPPYTLVTPENLTYSNTRIEKSILTNFTNKTILLVAFPGQSIKRSVEFYEGQCFEFDVTDKDVNSNVLAFIKKTRIDIAFLQYQQTPITIELLTELHNSGIFIINWTGDVRVPLPDWYKIISKSVNLTLFSNEDDPLEIRSIGQQSDFLNIGYNELIYTPVGYRKIETYDVVFMGNNYNDTFTLGNFRHDMVTSLYNKYGSKFGLFGINWKEFPATNLNNNPHEEAAIYRSSKMAISLSHYHMNRYFSDRMFRIMGCRTLCLAKRYPGIEKDFKDKVHLVVWDTIDQLYELIDYYKNNTLERLRIAYNGYEHVLYNHTWTSRIKELDTLITTYKDISTG